MNLLDDGNVNKKIRRQTAKPLQEANGALLERLLESGDREGGGAGTGKRQASRASRPTSAKRATGSRGGNAQKR